MASLHAAEDRPMQQPTRGPHGFGDRPESPETLRAEAPRAPALPAASGEAAAEDAAARGAREGVERRSILRGLVLLAWIALLVSALHAGLERVFPANRWHQW